LLVGESTQQQEAAASAAPAAVDTDNKVGLSPATLEALGCTAYTLAQLAGAEIAAAYGSRFSVEYKEPQPGEPPNSNPVSCVDVRVESLLRSVLAASFPEHCVIGEELPAHSRPSRFAWIIDPIDGTSNFINGVPLCASSIGVLFEGKPVAGAIWCATTHELRSGVYHSTAGGPVHLDGVPIQRRTDRRPRGLIAEPGMAPRYGGLGHTRVLGCAALELAFVAAGLLRIAYVSRPALWDVAAGVALLEGANCEVRAWRAGRWKPLFLFDSWQEPTTLAKWSEPLLTGDTAAVDAAADLNAG
jgi:myo-inositol-1(or 4)-monophosphatase